jgi:hypothetical protein
VLKLMTKGVSAAKQTVLGALRASLVCDSHERLLIFIELLHMFLPEKETWELDALTALFLATESVGTPAMTAVAMQAAISAIVTDECVEWN